MGKKLGLTSLFHKPKDSRSSTPPPPYSSASSWVYWPSCKHPRTHSFRAVDLAGGEVYKTVNSVYFDSSADSWFTNTSEEHSESFSTASDADDYSNGEALEMVIRGARSDRLFIEPGGGTSSSILEESRCATTDSGGDGGIGIGLPFKESMALAMESADPYRDFRASMDEMVAAHGMKDWKRLQELLVWYLRVNGKKTHGFILGAFVDLLVNLASSPSSSSSSNDHDPSSSLSSSVCFEIEEVDDDEEQQETSGSSFF